MKTSFSQGAVPRRAAAARAGRTLFILPLIMCVVIAACGNKETSQMTGDKTSYSAQVQKVDGKRVVVLERTGPEPLKASVSPSDGANLYSLICEGMELIYHPDDLTEFTGGSSGTPVLYPTPNRIAGGTFSFGGRTFDFGTNDGDRWLHGLVRTVPWEFDPPEAGEQSASVVCWIDFKPGTQLYELFGFEHRLSLIYTLDSEGIRVTYRVDNRDSRELPFGIALHPYFNYLTGPGNTRLKVPARWHMKAVDLMPTGELEELGGTPYDLREPTPLSEVVLDDVYFGMRPDDPAVVEYTSKQVTIELRASKDFTHMVVYVQPQNNFFCVENQTCSTDAHNLYAQGFVEESNLLIVPAGGSHEGYVHYVIR